MKQIAFGLLSVMATAGAATPPSKPVEGPMLLCFKYSTFQLAEQERVTEFSGSAEGMLITIEGPSGGYEIGESEIWAEPIHKGHVVFAQDRTTVYQIAGERRYSIYGLTANSPKKDVKIIGLSGKALRGNNKDRSIYRRFEVRDPEGASCGHGFTYSWDAILEQLPPAE